MSREEIEIPEIPHGHGLSFKRGVADGLLESNQYEDEIHDTHSASYKKGQDVGKRMKQIVAQHVNS